MKYLLFVALALVVWWLWRKTRSPSSDAIAPPPTPAEPERMVECAFCGVNQPISESVLEQGRYYCCAAHLRQARSTDR